jgi:hypothetical protein
MPKPRHLLPLAGLAGLLALAPAHATAKPTLCFSGAVEQLLIADGKLTEQDVKARAGVDDVRCGDVTADGTADAVFGVASGGTAGDTRFGVYRGGEDPKLVLYKQGYGVALARHDRSSFDVLQPHFSGDEPNCCPGSFRIQRYTWNGRRFTAGPSHKAKKVPRRFHVG